MTYLLVKSKQDKGKIKHSLAVFFGEIEKARTTGFPPDGDWNLQIFLKAASFLATLVGDYPPTNKIFCVRTLEKALEDYREKQREDKTTRIALILQRIKNGKGNRGDLDMLSDLGYLINEDLRQEVITAEINNRYLELLGRVDSRDEDDDCLDQLATMVEEGILNDCQRRDAKAAIKKAVARHRETADIMESHRVAILAKLG